PTVLPLSSKTSVCSLNAAEVVFTSHLLAESLLPNSVRSAKIVSLDSSVPPRLSKTWVRSSFRHFASHFSSHFLPTSLPVPHLPSASGPSYATSFWSAFTAHLPSFHSPSARL